VRAATKDEKVCGIVENNTTKSGRARNLENAASCEAKLAATTYITIRATTLLRFYREPSDPHFAAKLRIVISPGPVLR
jgi:hypothetical protein